MFTSHHGIATRSLLASALLLLACFICASASASITGISGPFVGNLSERWESRANYLTPSSHLEPNPTTIMNGGAIFSSPAGLGIYQPGVADFSGGLPPVAFHVSDGLKGLAVNGTAISTITFTTPVSDFGAFWGSGSPSNGITVRFFDSSSTQIDSPQFFSYMHNGSFPGGDGTLDWHGWHSTIPIKSLTFSGDFAALDGLQANTPEPGSLGLLLATGAFSFYRRRSAIGA